MPCENSRPTPNFDNQENQEENFQLPSVANVKQRRQEKMKSVRLQRLRLNNNVEHFGRVLRFNDDNMPDSQRLANQFDGLQRSPLND